MINSAGDKVYDYTFAEGNGTKVFDISGQGNHATISGATYTTANSIASHNHQHGFSIKNYFPAGTMELGTTWSKDNATTAYNTSIVYQGNTSLQIQKTFDASNYNQGYIYSTFTTDSTGTYTISARVKGTAGQKFSFAVFNQTDGGFALTRGSSEKTLTGEWDLFSDNVSLTKDKVYRFYFALKDFNQVVYVDDARAETTTKSPALPNKTKQGYTGDGVADKIHFNHSINASSAFDIESEFIVNDPSLSLQAVFSATGSTTNDRGFFLRYEASSTRWLLKIADTTFYINSHTIARGDVYKFKIEYLVGNKVFLHMTKNGVTTTPIYFESLNHTPDFNGQAALGALRWSTSYSGFTFKTCKFTQGTTTNVELDIANSAGLSTVADLSGNGNNGTLQSATVSLNWVKDILILMVV